MWTPHVGYVVLHRNKTWFCLACNDDLFFAVNHTDCNVKLDLVYPSLQLIKTASRDGHPFSESIIITHLLRVLQRRIKKRIRRNTSFPGLMKREISGQFPLKPYMLKSY